MTQNRMLQENAWTPLERLRYRFADVHFRTFTLRGWFGKGFLAIREIDDQMSGVLVRERSDGYEAQYLEGPTPQSVKRDVVKAGRWAKVPFRIHPRPYNDRTRRKHYKWRYLILIRELREAAQAVQGEIRPDPHARQVLPTSTQKPIRV